MTPVLQSMAGVANCDESVETAVYLLNSYHKLHATLSLLHTTDIDARLQDIQASGLDTSLGDLLAMLEYYLLAIHEEG